MGTETVFFISGCYTGNTKKRIPGEPVTFNASYIIGYRISRNTDDDVYYRY